MFRLAAGPLFVVLALNENYEICFSLLWLAALSDWLDGWVARRTAETTHFGSFLDPIADKAFFACVFALFYIKDWLPWWLIAIVLMRDITMLILGAVSVFCKISGNFEPLYIGKITTFFQFALSIILLDDWAFNLVSPVLPVIYDGVIYTTASMTLLSALTYLKRFLQSRYNSSMLD